MDDPAGRMVRSRSFGAVADDYDRYRPGPPAAAVDWVAALLGGRARPPGDRTPPGQRHPFDVPAGAPFRDLDTTVIEWPLARTEDELIGLTGTYTP
jgi:hypothetical protein